jgi:hypothetical protein
MMLDGNPGTPAEYLPLKALAVYSGLCVRTLRGYLTHPSRPLPHYRIGGRVVVRRSEYDAWVQAFRVARAGTVNAVVDEILSGL